MDRSLCRAVGAASSSRRRRTLQKTSASGGAAALAAAAGTAVAVLFAAPTTKAGNVTWDGGAASPNWAAPVNWSADIAPAALDTLFFDGSANTSTNNDLAALTTINGIVFNTGAASFTLAGNGIVLGSRPTPIGNVPLVDGIFNNSPNAQLITLPITLGTGRHYFTTTAGSGTLSVNGAITRQIAATAAFNLIGGAIHTSLTNDATGLIGGWAVAVNSGAATPTGSWAAVDGSGNIVPFGAFSATFSGGNITGTTATSNINVTGGVTVPAGTTNVNTMLLTATGAATHTLTGTLNFSNGGGIFRALDAVATQTFSGGTITAGSGTATLYIRTRNSPIPDPGAGPPEGLTIASAVVNNGGPLTIVKSGFGVLRLDGANSFSGGLYLNEGQLRPSTATAMGTGSVVVADGAQMLQGGAVNQANPFFISGFGPTEQGGAAGQFRGGALRFNSAGGIFSGTITLLGDAGIGARGGQANNANPGGTVSGKITGPFSLALNRETNQGAGGVTSTTPTITLANPANDWTGDTIIGRGRTRVGAAEVIPDGAGKGNVIIFGEQTSESILTVDGRTETINGLSSGGDSSLAVVTNSAVATGTLIFGNNNAGGSYGGRFADDTGKLVIQKIGNGTEVITGSNHSFTGNTIIAGGTLQLGSGANLNSSPVIETRSGGTYDVSQVAGYAVPANQVLGGGGAVAGNVTMSDGAASIAPGLVGTAGTLSFSNGLTLSGGNVRLDLNNTNTTGGGVNDYLRVTGALNLSSPTNVTITRVGGTLQTGTYQIGQMGSITGPLSNLVMPVVRQGLTANFTGGFLNLVVGSGAPGTLIWAGDGSGNTWDLNNTANFKNASNVSDKFFDWDAVTFDDNGSATPNININGTLQPDSFTVNTSTKSYTFNGGTLINVNTFVKSGSSAATFNNSLNRIVSGTISGGTLVLQNNTNFSSLTINSGGVLSLVGGNQGIITAGVAASGARVLVTGQATFGNMTIASGGTLTIGDGVNGSGEVNGTVTNNGAVILDRPGDWDSKTVYAGSGNIRRQQSGQINMMGASPAFTGTFDLTAGRIKVSSFDALGSTSAGGTVTISDGAKLDLSGITTANVANGFGPRVFVLSGSGSPGDPNGDGVIFNNATVGQQNAFQKIILAGNATFGGDSGGTANAGRYDIRAAQVGGVNQATLDLGNFTLTKKGNMQLSLVNVTVSGNGNIVLNEGTLGIETTTILGGTGSLQVNNGATWQFFNSATPSTITRPIFTTSDTTTGNAGGGSSSVASNIVLGGNLTVTNLNGAAGSLTLTGNISETGGAKTLTKRSNGNATTNFNTALILTGTNTYTGNTNVESGTLRVNGTHTGGQDYNVNNAGQINGVNVFGTIGGSGTISARVNVNNGAALSPGANTGTIGTLTVGSLSLDTATLSFDVGASGVDRVNVTNANGLNLPGGTNTFTFADLGSTHSGTFTLIDYSGTALADLSKFTISNPTLGALTFALVNNTANTSVDLTITGGITTVNATWNVDANGNWSTAGNWLGGVPGSVDDTANFGTIITASRTVTLDSARSVGTMNFSSPNSYTIAGTSTLTLDVSTGAAAINVTAGSHTVSAPVVLNDNTTITSSAGSGIALTGALTATGKTITKAGAGTAQFENVRATGLTVNAGSAKISAKGTPNSAAGTSVVTSLTIASGANLDLTNNSAVIDYTGAVGTLVGDVRQHLQSGRLSTSSGDANRRLGYGDNAVLNKATFAGQTVDASSLLIKFTYAGDSNLDGQVDVTDLGNLATNWQASAPWTGGDFDYSGFVDVTDLGMLATNWQAGVGSPLGRQSFEDAIAAVGLGNVSVPEPATFGLFSLYLAGVLARRSRSGSRR